MKLPADATPEQIQIEAAIRKKVDFLISALPSLKKNAFENPISMIDGFIELGSGTSDSRHYMVCVLANKMDPNLVAEKTEDKSSPIKWIGKAIGYFNDLNDPAVRFETLKSPSIKDLVQAVEDQGLKAHITFAASKSCHLENTDIKKVIKHSYSKESALYGVVRISL